MPYPAGHPTLREHRLSKDAETWRVVTDGCNLLTLLDYPGGHWPSLHRGRAPPASLPTTSASRPTGADLPWAGAQGPSGASRSGRKKSPAATASIAHSIVRP